MQVYGDWKYESEEFKIPSKEKNNENINLEVLENKYDSLIVEMQKEIDELKKNQGSNELENRKEKSKTASSQLVFNAEEDEIIKISSDNSIEVSSEYKFITTDAIDKAQKTHQEVWDSVRKAFSGRE